jgi:hypothetical protein
MGIEEYNSMYGQERNKLGFVFTFQAKLQSRIPTP